MKYFLTLLSFLLFQNLFASHIAGGDITYTCLGGNQYRINLNLFVDCEEGLEPGIQESVDFISSCGQNFSVLLDLINIGGTEVSQLCPTSINNSTCNGGSLPGMKVFNYTAVVTLAPACDTWTMSWTVCCRNGAILNLDTPDTFGSYIEATLNSATSLCNNSPSFTAQPIPYVCVNQPVNFDYGIVENDGDSLSFSLVSAMDAGATNLGYSVGFTPLIPITGIAINPLNGALTFTPATLGNFVVVVLVQEFDSNGDLIGTVMRDIQFIVENCSNIVPEVTAGSVSNFSGTATQTGPYSIDMCEGSSFSFDAVYTDLNAGDVLAMVSNIATVLPGSTVVTSGTNPFTATISWTATAGSSNSNTTFSVTINDGACPIMGIQNYVYNINVLSRTLTNSDLTICGTQTADLIASGGSTFTWNVLSGDPIIVGTNFSCNPCANPIATPSITTTYEVVSDLIGSCLSKDTVVVTVAPDFTFTTTKLIDSTICSHQLVQLDVTCAPVDAYSFSWTPANFLDNSTIFNPLANIPEPGTYKYFVDITSPLGCLKQDSISLTVFQIPNIILTGDTSICVGESVMLNFLSNTLETDDFNGATVNNSIWSNVNGAVLSTDCGSVTGNALHFDANIRIAETVAFNTLAGGNISFSLIIGTGGFPCEDADVGEDIVLEYSIDGGLNWINMGTFLTTSFATFTNVTIPIPAGALSASTLFRWNQINFSGTGTDNWALDDVSIDITSAVANGNYSFEWFDNQTSIGLLDSVLVSPGQTTTYNFVLTDTLLNCQVLDSIKINAGAVFTLTSSNDTILCTPTAISLQTVASNLENNSYSWSPLLNLTSPNDSVTIANPTVTTSYIVSVLSPQGCEIQDTVLVQVGQQIEPEITGDTLICVGESVMLNALFGSSLSDDFNGAAVNNSIWSNVNGAVLSTDCGSVSGNALHFDANLRIAETVAFNTLAGGNISFSLIIGSGGFPCEDADAGEDIVLEYSVDGGLNWINMGTFLTTSFVTFTNVTIPIPAGALSATTLFRWNQINFSGTGSDNWALDDVSIDITSAVANGNYSFEWFDNQTSIGLLDSVLVSPGQTTTYNFVLTDTLLNCQVLDSIKINAGAVFTLTSSNDTILCTPTAISLQTVASNLENNSYSWSPVLNLTSPTDSVTIANPTVTTTYIVSVLSPQGCEIQDTVVVQVGQQIELEITGDTLICVGESVMLNALFGSSVSDDFNGAAVNNSIWSNVNGAILSTDCGSVSGNALHFDANIDRVAETVAFNTLAGGNINFSLIIGSGGFPCEDADAGEDIVLEYSIDGGINWINMGTFLTTSFATFTNVTIPIPAGALSASTLFRWNQINFSGTGSDNWALDDVSIDITSAVANGDYSFEWFDNQTSIGLLDSVLVSPGQTTTYNFVLTDTLLNCQILDSIKINAGPVFTLTTSNDTTKCNVASISLGTIPSIIDTYTYSWLPLLNLTAPNSNLTNANPNSTTNYVVSVSSSSGCTLKDSVLVTILPPLNISISGDNSICAGESSVLTASGGLNYTWNNSPSLNVNTGNTVSVDPTITENFRVIASTNFCIDSADFLVNVNQAPLATLTSSNELNCLNNSSILSASSPGNTVVWNGNGLVNAVNPVSVSLAGVYNATVVNPITTCSAIYPLTLTLADSVIASFNLNPSSGTTPLTVDFTNTSQNASTYFWDFGNGETSTLTNPSTIFLTSGVDTITLIAINSLGCEDSIKLTINLLEPKLTCETVQLIVPNIITVNGDNINNFWDISYNSSDVFTFSCIILNRWGNLVAEINDINKSWGGNDLNGEPCSAGVYFYKINLKCELDEKELKGFIHLVK